MKKKLVILFMDWITILQFILSWWPWVSLWSEVWFIQLSILYLFFLILFATNVYYVLLYLFFEIFYFGLFLALYQMEFFTGFLWAVECTVIFIAVLLLFYLNYTGILNKQRNISYLLYYCGFFFLIFFNYDLPGEFENYVPIELNISDLWEDYYEALANTNMNDFMGLLVTYYYVNSFEFILIGILLLIGSVGCVNLFKANRLERVINYDNFFRLFNLFVDFIDNIFLRKQGLMRQASATVSTRMFKKK